MNKQSIYVYLTMLAVFDSLVLYFGLIRTWVNEIRGSDIRDESAWLCKGLLTLAYTCSDVSVWLIVAVTLERYLVVSHPLKAHHFSQDMRAKKIIAGIVILFFLVNVHFLFSTDLMHVTNKGYKGSEYQCKPVPGYEGLIYYAWPWVDALLYGFGPFVLISVLNAIIILKSKGYLLLAMLSINNKKKHTYYIGSNRFSQHDVPLNHTMAHDVPLNHTMAHDVPLNHTMAHDVPLNHTMAHDVPLNHTMNHDVPKLTLKHTMAHDVPNLTLNHTMAHNVPNLTLNHTMAHDLPNLTINLTMAHDVPQLTLNLTMAHDVPQRTLNHTMAHDVPQLTLNHTMAHDVPQLTLNHTMAHDVNTAYTKPHDG
ncbi:hypothetical protein Btru_046172 [Bulinus truncatus]|nr:hypothetical protein Btru_046172 [Bulinus truncatus]